MLPDRTPHTLTMMSHNIFHMDFYDLWHLHPHLPQFTSVHPFCFQLDCFHLSQPPTDKAHPQLIPVKLGYHPWISQLQHDLWHSSLWRKGGEMQWKRQTIGTLK